MAFTTIETLIAKPIDINSLIDGEEIINWCEENCTLAHKEDSEYHFWIPPFNNHQQMIEQKYPHIPEIIENLLLQAIHQQIGKQATGNLSIIFIG